MPAPDDISDMFDDELAKSIAKGQDGPWRNDESKFVDPTLKELEEHLSGHRRRSYRERRLDELKQRGAEPEQAPPTRQQAPAKQPRQAPPARDRDPAVAGLAANLWGEGEFHETASPPAIEPQVGGGSGPAAFVEPATGEPANLAAAGMPTSPLARITTPSPPPRQRTRTAAILPFVGAITSASFAIGLAAAAHGVMTGWSMQLLLRAFGVAVISGLAWQLFRTGRLRSTAIAACAYTAGFLPSSEIGRIEHIIALFLGMFAVVTVAALLGDRRQDF